jgi:predicted HTH transcriptional regulator
VTLQQLIAQGEHQSLDFKFRIDDQKKIARTLSAFANTDGGILLIGVKDNGKITGIDPSEEFHMIQAAAEMYCQPEVLFEMKTWQQERHLVLQIEVPKSTDLVRSITEDGSYKAYIRIKDQTILANKIIVGVWKQEKNPIPRPQQFTDEVIHILKCMDQTNYQSISQLYKLTQLPRKMIDATLIRLLGWNVIGFDAKENQIVYFLKK